MPLCSYIFLKCATCIVSVVSWVELPQRALVQSIAAWTMRSDAVVTVPLDSSTGVSGICDNPTPTTYSVSFLYRI